MYTWPVLGFLSADWTSINLIDLLTEGRLYLLTEGRLYNLIDLLTEGRLI